MYAIQSRSTPTDSPTPMDALTALARRGNSALPRRLRQQALSMSLNRVFAQALHQGELDFMRGRPVRIVVLDMQLDFSITLLGRQLDVSLPPRPSDVTLRAALPGLLNVIAGNLDPDTLFFRRKLSLEGDTELGLTLKNFLDSQEPQQLIPGPAYRLVTHLASMRGAQP